MAQIHCYVLRCRSMYSKTVLAAPADSGFFNNSFASASTLVNTSFFFLICLMVQIYKLFLNDITNCCSSCVGRYTPQSSKGIVSIMHPFTLEWCRLLNLSCQRPTIPIPFRESLFNPAITYPPFALCVERSAYHLLTIPALHKQSFFD